jgi:membrane protease YdiL (CAAX protease family)
MKNTSNHIEIPAGSKYDWAALLFAIVFPSVVTIVYFQLLADVAPTIQQTAYAVGKTWQFGFPIAWVYAFYRSRLRRRPNAHDPATATSSQLTNPTSGRLIDYIVAIAFGVLVVATMIILFYLVIKPSAAGERLIQMVREKIDSMGLDAIWKYVAVGCFYTVVHSFMEEYYWRWFVYDLAKKFCSALASNIVSSLGFAAHHVILLGFFFGWTSPWTYVISAAIAIGGMVWAGMYERDGKLGPPWISHAIVDAGIFTLGYLIWTG